MFQILADGFWGGRKRLVGAQIGDPPVRASFSSLITAMVLGCCCIGSSFSQVTTATSSKQDVCTPHSGGGANCGEVDRNDQSGTNVSTQGETLAATAGFGAGVTPYLTVLDTDFAMFGQGGLRGNSVGSISVVNVTGAITRALLVWHGPTSSGDSSNSSLKLSGVPVTGNLLAVSEGNNWWPAYPESRSYVADVSTIVTGNGNYSLGQLANSSASAMNGASLLVFYKDAIPSNNRDIVVFLGNDSNIANPYDALGWSANLSGVNFSGGSAKLRLIVSDGQSFLDFGLKLNGVSFLAPGQNFAGNTLPNASGSSVINGGLWDHKEYDISSRLVAGLNSISLTDDGNYGYYYDDALSLVGLIFDLPVGSAPGTLDPTSARVDISQQFYVTGSGFTNATTFAVENCTADASVTPVITTTTATFNCIPRLPGSSALLINGIKVVTAKVFVDHPTRTGDPGSRGIPAVKGVSLFNGNYHHEITDMSVPGKGLPFTLSRSYNSYYSDYESGRGSVDNYHPWRFNWDLTIQYVPNTSNRQVSVAREDGSGESFYKDTDNNWYPINQRGFGILRPETPGAGFITYTTRDGRNYVFQNPDLGGKLQSVADHDGFMLQVYYGSNGKVDHVIDTVGRTFSFSYWPSNLLKRVTDLTGRYVEYTWESDTAPITGAARDRIKTVSDVRRHTTTYNYSSNNSATEPRMFLTSVVDARANTVVQLTHAKEAYGNWGVKTLTDASGYAWGFQYCSDATITEYCGTSPPATVAGFVTYVTAPLAAANFKTRFNLAGRFVSKTDGRLNTSIETPQPTTGLTVRTYALAGLKQAHQTPKGNKTQFTYYPEGNLQTQTNPDTGVLQSTWVAGGAPNCYNLTQAKSPQGVVHTMGYDVTCKPTTSSVAGLPASSNTYDPTSKLLSTTVDPLGNTTSFPSYDSDGNLLTRVDAKGQTVTYQYDRLGRLLHKLASSHTAYTYDDSGNLKTENVNPPIFGTGLGLLTKYDYDENNNQITVTNPRGYVTTTAYDSANRVSSVTRQTGTPIDAVTRYGYDELGRVRTVTNANTHTSTTSYDPAGNVSSRSDAMLPSPRVNSYTYDEDDRVLTQTDPEGRITTFGYDAMGRVTSVATADGTVLTAYDTDGRVTSQTDKRGVTTTYRYDPAGRRDLITNAANDAAAKTETFLGYDNAGRLTSIKDARGNTTRYEYDPLGRRVKVIDPKLREWLTAYNTAGNVASTQDPSGNIATYSYDSAGRLIGIAWSVGGTVVSSVSYKLDKNGNRSEVTDSTGTTLYGYDGMDRVTSVTNPQGQTVTYAYDGVGNVVTLGYPGGHNVSYGYDEVEHMVSLADWTSLSRTTFTLDRSNRLTNVALRNGTSTAISYDPAGRLIALTHSKGATVLASHNLVRDANGNITADTGVVPLLPNLAASTLTRTYDTDNRQIGITHDLAGRVTNNGSLTLGWNALDQVASINGEAQTYTADGMRVAQTAGGVTTRFVMDTSRSLPNVLAETNTANAVQRYYIHSNYGLVAQIDAAGNSSFYHFDPSGNTQALTNASGQVTDTYAYTPFGETTRSGSTPNPFQFAGQYGVRNYNNTQLYDMRARWYAADQARFLSLDPLLGDVNDPQTLNRYAYVGGNPVMRVDPSGLCDTSMSSCPTDITPDDARDIAIGLMTTYSTRYLPFSTLGSAGFWISSVENPNFFQKTIGQARILFQDGLIDGAKNTARLATNSKGYADNLKANGNGAVVLNGIATALVVYSEVSATSEAVRLAKAGDDKGAAHELLKTNVGLLSGVAGAAIGGFVASIVCASTAPVCAVVAAVAVVTSSTTASIYGGRTATETIENTGYWNYVTGEGSGDLYKRYPGLLDWLYQ